MQGLTERNDMKSCKTDFLFARPTVASGAARLFDFWGLFDRYNESFSTEEADSKAIHADWCLVGKDMLIAMEEFERTNK